MRCSNIFALPTALLVLLSGAAHSTSDNGSTEQWPYSLPEHVKYWPEDPPFRRRDVEATVQQSQISTGRTPIGIKKMGVDQGEKFYPEYWQYDVGQSVLEDWYKKDGTSKSKPLWLELVDDGRDDLANVSKPTAFRPPFSLHANRHVPHHPRLERNVFDRGPDAILALLESRQFQCPTGTNSCSNIDHPNSCCATDETCFLINDTGLGEVGCCSTGSNCSGQIYSCDAGYTACADNLGGGCCMPGYSCSGVGCKYCIANQLQDLLLNYRFRHCRYNFYSHSNRYRYSIILSAPNKLNTDLYLNSCCRYSHIIHNNHVSYLHRLANNSCLLFVLPRLSCEPWRRLLPFQSPVWHDGLSSILRCHDKYEHHYNNRSWNHNSHRRGSCAAYIRVDYNGRCHDQYAYCRSMSYRILCMRSLLCRRLLPDRQELRYHVLSGDVFRDCRLEWCNYCSSINDDRDELEYGNVCYWMVQLCGESWRQLLP